MSFPRYPEYKDSGVEWLGEVPAHWETWKVAHAFGLIGSGTTPPSSEEHWYDSVGTPWVTTGELRENIIFETSKSVTDAALEKFSALRIHPAGSLVVAMYGATIGRLGILGVDAVTNQACCVLSYPRHLDIAFTYYWLQGFKQIIIDLFSTGGGQPNINQDTVASLRIPAPGLPEQTAIATFLDRETAKIDALVAEQEKLIALLQEKRQAVISHAVTKGLDPNVPMKDSGVEWLGEVPGHWDVTPVRWAAKCRSGDGVSSAEIESVEDEEHQIPAIGGNGLMGYTSHSNIAHAVLAIGRVGALCGNVHIVNVPAWITDNALILDPEPEIFDLQFMSLVLRTRNLNDIAAKTAQPLITGTQVSDQRLPCPPLSEQRMIYLYVETETKKFDGLTDQAKSAITLLQERRIALISAAVTGQIDVRGLVGSADAPDSIAACAYPASA